MCATCQPFCMSGVPAEIAGKALKKLPRARGNGRCTLGLGASRQAPPMTGKAISPLRQRLIDDMAIRRLGPKTQHEYIRRVKSFADFVGRSPDKATAEDVHRYQLRLASIGATVSTVNATASALRF